MTGQKSGKHVRPQQQSYDSHSIVPQEHLQAHQMAAGQNAHVCLITWQRKKQVHAAPLHCATELLVDPKATGGGQILPELERAGQACNALLLLVLPAP